MLTTDILPIRLARQVLTQSRSDVLAHAGVSLLLLAGLRPREVEQLRVADCGEADGMVRLAISGRAPREIHIAPTAGRAVKGYLATQSTDPGDSLLPELTVTRLVQLVRATAAAADVAAGVHDLRRAAVAAALEDGAPVHQVHRYFGVGVAPHAETLVGLAAGYDVGVARAMEVAFVSTGE